MSYPYETAPSGRYVLTHDERGEIMRGFEIECWRWLHRAHSYSVEHALRYEGYDMRPESAGLPCQLCGGDATRYQDHGADGVLLFCDGHDAGEVEPLACEPLSAAPALYTVNGEGVTTLAGFLAANTDNIIGCLPEDGVCAVDEETIAAIRALDVGGEYSDGGGAWAEWTIGRVR